MCIICAIQENAISTKHTKKHIHETIEDDTSRVCKKKKKKMKQPNTLYQATLFWQQQSTLKGMTKYMHICLAKKYEFLENVSKWYNYNPEPQFDTDLAKIL